MNCPYCGGKLEKKPTRKKKCPHCSEFIMVRRGELYTEKQVEEMEFKNRWLSWLERYGASEKMFTRERKRLSKQFGFTASVNDTIWGMMNDLTSKNQRNPYNLEKIYLLMGRYVEEEGKDPSPHVQEAMKWKEYRIKQEVLENKKFTNLRVAPGHLNDEFVCDECRKVSKRTYSYKEFLKTMPIPKNCTNSHGCRCGVGFEAA